jgi:hypothetical protein
MASTTRCMELAEARLESERSWRPETRRNFSLRNGPGSTIKSSVWHGKGAARICEVAGTTGRLRILICKFPVVIERGRGLEVQPRAC